MSVARPVRIRPTFTSAHGGFYFQAFSRSVSLPAAGYNYNSVWTPCMGFLLSSDFRVAISLSCFLDQFLCSTWNSVSSSRPAVLQSRRAQELSRLAVAPTLRRAPPSPGHTLTAPSTMAPLGTVGMTIRGEPAVGHGSIAPQPCIRWVQRPEP